jgi:aconitase B
MCTLKPRAFGETLALFMLKMGALGEPFTRVTRAQAVVLIIITAILQYLRGCNLFRSLCKVAAEEAAEVPAEYPGTIITADLVVAAVEASAHITLMPALLGGKLSGSLSLMEVAEEVAVDKASEVMEVMGRLPHT